MKTKKIVRDKARKDRLLVGVVCTEGNGEGERRKITKRESKKEREKKRE